MIKKTVSVLQYIFYIVFNGMHDIFLDEKAVQFAQAEKLYYEAALVNSPGTAPSRNLTQNNVSMHMLHNQT